MTTTINNTTMRLEFNHLPQSRGAYSIIVEAFTLDNNHGEIFRARTTDMDIIDRINDMKADDARSEDIDAVYYNHVISDIEEKIYEWVDKCDMEDIMNEANDQLGGGIFDYDSDWGNVYNYTNRYEGNDLDMVKRYGNYELSVTGEKRIYGTKEEAIQGLIDMYSAQ